MLRAIGDTIWGIGQFAYATGEVVVKTVANATTCGAYNEAQRDLAEAGERVKHDAEVLVSTNETLEERNQELKAELAELKAQDSNTDEVTDKQLDEILDLQVQIEALEEEKHKLGEEASSKDAQIESLKKDVAAAELCAEQEADSAKELKEKVDQLQAGIAAAKKGKK